MVYGVAGVGKTTLLREFAARCSEAGRPTILIDGRDISATPDAFEATFTALAGDQDTGSIVLMIDNYETLEPLDRWIRESFVPNLPADYTVLIAGRRAPAAGWRTDPAWGDLFVSIRVDNLAPAEAAAYLRGRAVPESGIGEALEFTGGHPLALSLVAELYASSASGGLKALASTDVIQSLIERFVEAAPDDDHRRALEVCAFARVTTEALVASSVPGGDGHALFRWLQNLSFVELGPFGLVPHELARTAIVADLKWRNPARSREIRAAARLYYREALARLSGPQQQAILFDYIYLHRDSPAIAAAFDFDAERTRYLDALRPADVPAVLEMVRTREGDESARIASFWLARQPENAFVIRNAEGHGDRPCGFLMQLAIEAMRPDDGSEDPATKRLLSYIEATTPLRSGERGAFYRFWMDEAEYQNVSPGQSLIFVQIVLHALTSPRLALTFVPCRDATFWSPMFLYAGFSPAPEAETPPFGLYAHDWRIRPPLVWLELLAEREEAPERLEEPKSGPEIAIFDRDRFALAVQKALRDCLSPEKLKASELLRSRMIADHQVKSGSDGTRSLQELLREAAMTMRAEARDQKLFRVLRACYFESSPSQEAAAEKLEIGIATLRRQLKEATERVVAYLWSKETG
jgi:hypothetical protein